MHKYLILTVLLTLLNTASAAQLVVDDEANKKLEFIREDTSSLKSTTEDLKQQLQETNRALSNIEEALDMQEESDDVTNITKGYSAQMLFFGLDNNQRPSGTKHTSEFNNYSRKLLEISNMLEVEGSKTYMRKQAQKDLVKASYIYRLLESKRTVELAHYEKLIGQADSLKETMDLNNKLLITLIAERQASNLLESLNSLERVLGDTTINNLNE